MVLPLSTFSQVLLSGNLYTENKYAINPAYAGINVRPHVFISYKKVASSISGAPELLSFGISSGFYQNMSLGGRFFKQSEGLFSTITGFVDYSYKLKISDKQNIRFGISGGINSSKLDYDNIIAEDPTSVIDVASRNFEGVYFESSAGIVYQWDRLEISLAAPKFFESKNNIDLSLNSLILYHFRLKEKEIELRPGFFINYVPGNPVLYDINLQAQWKESFWVGVGYRNRPGIIVSAGLNFSNIGIAYATEFSTSKFANMFNQTHEISVFYAFTKRKRLPNDTLISPINNLIAKKDTLSNDSIINVVVVENSNNLKNNVDTVSTNEKENEGPNYELMEVGDGVYVIKPAKIDTLNNENEDNIYEDENISEQDSAFTINLVSVIENKEQQFDYELIDSGEGVYTIRSDSLKSDAELEDELLDSILKETDFSTTLDITDDSNNSGTYYHSVYYTLRLYINKTNQDLLTYVELVDKARVENDAKGNVKYYYGYFSSIEEALRYQKKFNKFDNLQTEVQRFHAYQ